MSTRLRLIEPERDCPYLPSRMASLEYLLVTGLSVDEYSGFLERGYRRFGDQLFRPACPQCSCCVSLRVMASEFRPNRSQRRSLATNRGIRAEIHPLFATPAHLELYDRYHLSMAGLRGWGYHPMGFDRFARTFLLEGGEFGRQWLFTRGPRLLGVAFMDELPDAVSLVYFFHDPEWRSLSPGTFAIVTQIEYARRKGLRYAYLGYWIEDCFSMSYKSRFNPHELLAGHPGPGEEPRWVRRKE